MFTRLSFLFPGRLPHSSFPVELVDTVPSINYGLTSHYSGNWSVPKRSWFRRNWSRIDIMRYAVNSHNLGPTKPTSSDNKTNNTGVNTTNPSPTKSQIKIETEWPKISGAELNASSNSSTIEILNIGAKLEKAKAKESASKVKDKNMNITANASRSDMKPGEVIAKSRGLMENIKNTKIETKSSSTDTEFQKEESEKNVAEKTFSAMQAKLGVVEAKLSKIPQAKFGGADYALKPKELLKEISRSRHAQTQRKIVIDNSANSGFFKKVNKMRLEKWMKFPKSRFEGNKSEKFSKDKENHKK